MRGILGMNNPGTTVFPVSSCSPFPRPDLSSCHRCGLLFPVDGSIDGFRILESQWRIVLLCHDCLDCVRSAKVCSYCFLGFPELEKALLRCIMCSCRVHRSCVPLHHRNLWSSHLDTSNFLCVDCCPIPKFCGVDFIKSGVSTSKTRFSCLLEDLFQGEKSVSEKKLTREGKARKNTVRKSMVVRDSTEVTEKAEGVVRLSSAHINFAMSDEQLALRLHRSMNGSQRFSRSLFPIGETHLPIRKLQDCHCSASRIVDSNSYEHHSKVQVCSQDKPVPVDRQSSQSILTSGLFKRSDEVLSKQISGHNTEGLACFSLKEREIYLKSPDSTSHDSNFGSVMLRLDSLKSQLNNNIALKNYLFDVGEDSTELQQKNIDASGQDRYKKQYVRRRWGSRRFIVS